MSQEINQAAEEFNTKKAGSIVILIGIAVILLTLAFSTEKDPLKHYRRGFIENVSKLEIKVSDNSLLGAIADILHEGEPSSYDQFSLMVKIHEEMVNGGPYKAIPSKYPLGLGILIIFAGIGLIIVKKP